MAFADDVATKIAALDASIATQQDIRDSAQQALNDAQGGLIALQAQRLALSEYVAVAGTAEAAVATPAFTSSQAAAVKV